ncbi:S-adenosyl-L-methionine-dependent methyltransferase [Ascodesmis nigricans]|uniref:S-adenosyl-L-methionine-dependent methyltransferase n=1 Tax=Ascodesmis nigricans TaxID=341454 RepID=A0A4S2N2W9_9PEZI|nr:S-adenosyl-L-methionine-dependent methyltransferase [Ascodesmis nigricans]
MADPKSQSACPTAPVENPVESSSAAPIEADDTAHFSDYDDDGSSQASSTQSLSSSIKEQFYENGRKYHRKTVDEGHKYLLPSDETELDRLDMTHHMALVILDGELHKAPIKGDPHNVLDCGTGTGIWALDFGSIHPGSHVIGVDLAPNQPSWTYPNVVFENDDLEKEWTYKKNHFDFIHSRMVGSAIKDWSKYTKQMFDHAAPGAYVEISEHSMKHIYCDDGSVPEDSVFYAYGNNLSDALLTLGVDVRQFSGSFFKRHLEEAGFVDVQVFTYKVPWGTWPKSKKFKYMGAVCAEILKTGFEAYGLMAMTRLLNIPEDEARGICNGCYKEIMAGKQHGYHYQWYVIGRKPELATK